MRIIQIALALIALFYGVATAGEKTVKLMAIGNSFSRNALKFLPEIVTASGNHLIVKHAMIGGCDFERHMRHADAFEANPHAPEGRPYEGKFSLKDLLVAEQWQYVTIQQASPKSFRPETFHPHADRLIAYIRKYAPQAEIIIHQTWAYRDDHAFWGLKNFNTDSMYKGVRETYDALAKERSLRQVPSGDAMEAARQDPTWGKFVPDPDFNPKTAHYPELPKNEKRSLHIGYTWKEHKPSNTYKLGWDKFHANAHGEYLQGCVWFEFFFEQSVVGNTFVPQNIAPADAAILQHIAHRVVTEKYRPRPLTNEASEPLSLSTKQAN